MNKVQTLKQRITARDWDEAILHHNGGEVPATWLKNDHNFELKDDDYLVIRTDQSVLPSSRALGQQAMKKAQEAGDELTEAQYNAVTKRTNGEFWIDLNQVVMFEFHKTVHIHTPKSMIITP